MKTFQTKTEAEKSIALAYELADGVIPRPLRERTDQMLKWHCPRCGVHWDNFESFAFDGCSPVFGVKSE